MLLCGCVLLVSAAVLSVFADPALPSKSKLKMREVEERFGCPPEGCGIHGTCRNNRCKCESGYAGEDCSVETEALRRNTPVQGNVQEGDWAYYSFEVPPASRWMFIINQTSSDQDCDLYVKFSDYPTRAYYDYRDITLEQNFALEEPEGEQRPGSWIAGVYGYGICQYSITAKLAGECNIDCNNHGSCHNDQCHCNAGWVGSSCEYSDQAIAVGAAPTSGSVAGAEWKYYHFTYTGADELLLATVEEQNGGSTSDAVDLYLQFGSPPSFASNYAYNMTMGAVTTLDIPMTQSDDGVVYLGVSGWQGGAYTIKVEVKSSGSEECQDIRCSDHGICRHNGACRCNSGFSGDDCETMDGPLALGRPVRGFVNDDEYNYYHIPVDTADTLVFSVHQKAGEADCDVYVKAGGRPSPSDFDYFDASLNQDFEVVVAEPGDQTWYVSVFGFRPCEYNITASLRTGDNCAGDCKNGGACTPDGECECTPDWAGADCSIPVATLENNKVLQGWVGHQQWRYYKFDTDPTSAVQFHLQETSTPIGGGGALWLFVSQEVPPTLGAYDSLDSSHTRTHHYSNNLGYKAAQLYYVGIYGSPLSPPGGNLTFSLVGWHPHF